MPRSFPHDPGDIAFYYVDFGEEGNQVQYFGQIVSVVWEKVGDADGDLVIESQSNDGLVCEVLVSGGVAGKVYRLTCVPTFSSGGKLNRSIELVCGEQ